VEGRRLQLPHEACFDVSVLGCSGLLALRVMRTGHPRRDPRSEPVGLGSRVVHLFCLIALWESVLGGYKCCELYIQLGVLK